MPRSRRSSGRTSRSWRRRASATRSASRCAPTRRRSRRSAWSGRRWPARPRPSGRRRGAAPRVGDTMEIDLNCDMGESFGIYTLGLDEEAMPLVSSANVACGFHASDPATMRRTVRLAKRYGVAVGAHPSYPDLVGFGRRPLDATPEQVRDDVVYQVGALWAFCRSEGVPLRHVKAHGALYNTAARDAAVADAIAD